MIKYLVFDVDNTLIDFDMSLIRAEKAIADRFGLQLSEDYFIKAAEMINAAWSEHHMSNTDDPDIQNEWHRRYRNFLLHHYENLSQRYGIACDPQELVKIHFGSIAEMHHTMEKETLEIYAALSKRFRNVLASNSVQEIKGRFSPFIPYTYKAFISDEIHAVKPDSLFFRAVISGLGCAPAECLMIGDSASDDMKGAKSAGFRTCWYRRGKGSVECEHADYHIDSITELPGLLEGMTDL